MATKKTAWKKPNPYFDIATDERNVDKLELAYYKKSLKYAEENRLKWMREKQRIERSPEYELELFAYYEYDKAVEEIAKLNQLIREIRAKISKLSKKTSQKRSPKANYNIFESVSRGLFPPSEYQYPKRISGKKRTAKRVSSSRK